MNNTKFSVMTKLVNTAEIIKYTARSFRLSASNKYPNRQDSKLKIKTTVAAMDARADNAPPLKLASKFGLYRNSQGTTNAGAAIFIPSIPVLK